MKSKYSVARHLDGQNSSAYEHTRLLLYGRRHYTIIFIRNATEFWVN
jgi:hypothetical protein